MYLRSSDRSVALFFRIAMEEHWRLEPIYMEDHLEVNVIIAAIDEQIAKLNEARRILESVSTPAVAKKAGRGRPKGSKNAATIEKVVAAATSKGKRKLSPEGRKRIADAMKRRWAEKKNAA